MWFSLAFCFHSAWCPLFSLNCPSKALLLPLLLNNLRSADGGTILFHFPLLCSLAWSVNIWILADVILAPLMRVSSCCQAPGWIRKLSSGTPASVAEEENVPLHVAGVKPLQQSFRLMEHYSERSFDDEFLCPVLLLPLLQLLSLCASRNTYLNNRKPWHVSAGVGWRLEQQDMARGAGSSHLSGCWLQKSGGCDLVWKQIVVVFGVMFLDCLPFIS